MRCLNWSSKWRSPSSLLLRHFPPLQLMHLERIGEAWQTQGCQRHNAKEKPCCPGAMALFETAHRHVSIDVFRLTLQFTGFYFDHCGLWLNKHDKKMGDHGISPIYNYLHTYTVYTAPTATIYHGCSKCLYRCSTWCIWGLAQQHWLTATLVKRRPIINRHGVRLRLLIGRNHSRFFQWLDDELDDLPERMICNRSNTHVYTKAFKRLVQVPSLKVLVVTLS